jgi:putative transcriptional regulator
MSQQSTPAAEPIDLSNQFLMAMPGMVDGEFAGTVIYLCEHGPKGALGLVINRPTDLSVAGLLEKIDLNLEIALLWQALRLQRLIEIDSMIIQN